jgi:malate synthase
MVHCTLDNAYSSHLSRASRQVRDAVDFVLFDLDDTLAPVLAQLMKATNAMKALMSERMPQTCALVDSNLRSLMKGYVLVCLQYLTLLC